MASVPPPSSTAALDLAASPEATPPLSPSPTPTLTPTPEADPPPASSVESLAAKFPAAAALIEAAAERVAVAVRTPDGQIHTGGDDGTFALASVAKVPVMVATLERARVEARSLTVHERTLLRQMIIHSDNDATDALWSSLGGGAGVAILLEALGSSGIDYAPDHQWGDSRATALAIAQLLDLLVDEASPVAAEARLEAIALMEAVVADQRWGASAGVALVTGGGRRRSRSRMAGTRIRPGGC